MFENLKNKIHKLKTIVGSIKNERYNATNLRNCEILFICHDNNRGINLNGKAYSPLIDSIRDDLEYRGFTCQTLARHFSILREEKAWGNPISINKKILISFVLDKISSFFYLKHLPAHKFSIKLFERIIDATDTKCIIAIGSFPSLCSAAHNKNIPCIEVLHGIGYTLIPTLWGWNKLEKNELPSHILSLDNISTTSFKALEKHDIQIIQIEHPFLRRFLIPSLKKNLPREWNKPFNEGEAKKIILISLLWGYDGEYEKLSGILKNGVIYPQFEEVIEMTKDNIFWGFRLHPVQLRQARYNKHIDLIRCITKNHSNTDYEWFSTQPLPTVLSTCSGHITMTSMTSYEAAYMGVPTLALCPTLQIGGIYETLFNDLVDLGYLDKKLMNIDTVFNWVENTYKKKPLLGEMSATDSNWENLVHWLTLNTKH